MKQQEIFIHLEHDLMDMQFFLPWKMINGPLRLSILDSMTNKSCSSLIFWEKEKKTKKSPSHFNSAQYFAGWSAPSIAESCSAFLLPSFPTPPLQPPSHSTTAEQSPTAAHSLVVPMLTQPTLFQDLSQVSNP